MKTDFDLLIVGGGMVGASLACALQHLPLRVGLVEAMASDAGEHPSFDARAIALSQGSKRILEALGVWGDMEREGVTPIRHIHVSERGGFGSARLSADDEGVEALGYVAEASAMGRLFDTAMARVGNLQLLRPAQVVSLTPHTDRVEARLNTPEGECEVTARLLVAADGGRSFVRRILGGERCVQLGYGQTAIISYVVTDRPHHFVAYERFTDTGPLALLPCGVAEKGVSGSLAEGPHSSAHPRERRWSLVWTARDGEVEEILALPETDFVARLQARLGYRAGRVLSTGPRYTYPLALQYLRDYARQRVIFIGNAAHTIHPVGGQGYNLGLRDVAALAEVVAQAIRDGEDMGGAHVMDSYVRWRKPDYAKVLAATDGLARLFSSGLEPLVSARNIGLMGLDLLPPARRLFARQFMGLLGRQPRLARGLKLTA